MFHRLHLTCLRTWLVCALNFNFTETTSFLIRRRKIEIVRCIRGQNLKAFYCGNFQFSVRSKCVCNLLRPYINGTPFGVLVLSFFLLVLPWNVRLVGDCKLRHYSPKKSYNIDPKLHWGSKKVFVIFCLLTQIEVLLYINIWLLKNLGPMF